MEKKKLILLLLSCAVITEAHAAYQGHVYVDSNRNGIYDKGEKVLKGIRVSDGLNVVKTNAEGVYTLPGHKRERFIFITTPSGYRTDNQYYRRINGTGQTYDFGLQPWKGRINIIRKTKRFAIPERAVYFLKTKRTAGGSPPPQNIFDRLTPVFT